MMPKQKAIFVFTLALSIVLSIQLTLTGLHSVGILPISQFSGFVSNGLMSLEFFALCIVYVIWLIQNYRSNTTSSYIAILKPAALFLFFAWLAYPITDDIYLYLQYGLMSLNQVNPYLTKAGDFSSSLNGLLYWSQSSTYGVVSQFFFVVAAKLVEVNLLLGIYGFKLICLAFHILNSYLIWRILKSKTHRDKVTTAYLLSPVLLFEQVTEAHLDVFLCTVLIAIDQFLKTRRYLSALLMTGVGFLTKTLPIIWLPLIGVFLVRQKRWRTLLRFLLIATIVLLVLQFTLFPTIEAWKSILNPGVGGRTAGSWHNLLGAALIQIKNRPSAQVILPVLFNRITLFLFATYYAITLGRIYWKRSISESRLSVEIGWVTFVLFAFATPWYQPWYATILLPIAALNLQARLFAIASFMFSLVGTIAYFCLSFDQTKAGILGCFLTMSSAIVVLLMRSKILAFIQAKFPHEIERDLQQMKQ